MRLAKPTTAWFKRSATLLSAIFIYSAATAQENSPYSRYGLGDIVPNQNIVNRGMGGISAGYAGFLNINFINPASLGTISNTLFDIGGEIDIRSLKSTTTPSKFSSTNTLISYLQVAVPVATKKMERKGTFWGLSFGLRPVSRINYKIEKNERLGAIDSLNTLYEGSGGLNQVNVSTGIKIKNISIGLSSGYTFGNKDYSTQLRFINDTVVYQKSNTSAQSRFGGVFLNAGLQYAFKTAKKATIVIGAYGNLQQNMRAKQDNVNETIEFDGNGGFYTIDTIDSKQDFKGTVSIPATYGLGFTYQDKNNHWLIGADFETTSWSNYRYYNEEDVVQDNWVLKAGAEYYPAKAGTASSKYWNFVRYRAGLYFGPDYIKIDKSRSNYAATLGASFPLTSPRIRRSEYVVLNAAVEAGGRGNKQSSSLRENILRFSFGISMNARWFQKRSYE